MNKNKGFLGLGLILAIIAVLVVGGGAYYLGTKNDSVPKNAEENNIQQENKTNPSKISVLEILGPENMNINQTGTWKVVFYGGQYIKVDWGDGKSTNCGIAVLCYTKYETEETAWTTITHEYEKAGSYTVTFTVVNPSTGKYLDTSIYVKVEGYFIESKTPLTITFPDSNSQLKVGSVYDIKWSGTFSLNGLSDHYYNVSLGGAPGYDYMLFLERIPAQKGFFTWKVPQDILPGKYLLHFDLEGTTGNQSAQSNSDYFQIIAPNKN